MKRLLRFAAAVVLACVASVTAAQKPAEMHGMSDAFAVPGVTLAWGVLRSPGGSPVVDIRIAVDPMTYPHVVVVARDPFGSGEHVLASSLTAGLTDLRVPRGTFERFPRTEFRFFGVARPQPSEQPKLVVDFVGVPDTTPEFPNEARLDAYLTERVVRAKVRP